MAYINKAQYDIRRENAASRNLANETIAVENGMTQEQAELISELCVARHELHTNMVHVVKSDERYIKKSLITINAKIASTLNLKS